MALTVIVSCFVQFCRYYFGLFDRLGEAVAHLAAEPFWRPTRIIRSVVVIGSIAIQISICISIIPALASAVVNPQFDVNVPRFAVPYFTVGILLIHSVILITLLQASLIMVAVAISVAVYATSQPKRTTQLISERNVNNERAITESPDESIARPDNYCGQNEQCRTLGFLASGSSPFRIFAITTLLKIPST
jgi:hypothetical protein